MTTADMIPETAVDPICGKTVDPHKIHLTVSDDKGIHYFCSEDCRRHFNAADTKTKKGIWARYTERLKNANCTRTPPECR